MSHHQPLVFREYIAGTERSQSCAIIGGHYSSGVIECCVIGEVVKSHFRGHRFPSWRPRAYFEINFIVVNNLKLRN